MKKFSLIVFLVALNLFAQENTPIIEATTDKNVFLFFPSPISKALSGNGDFQFGYDTETAEKFGVLKAVAPKGESTLHIITEDESVYSFIVKYNANVSVFEHFFDGSEAVGNIGDTKKNGPSPGQDQDLPNQGSTASKITEANYYNVVRKPIPEDIDFCKELIERKDFFKALYRSKSNIVLRVSNIAYRGDKTFICLTLENNSTLDYDINFVQFNKIAKKASKKSSYQAIEINYIPESSYQTFSRVESFELKKAVYVFEKLSLDKNKLINIELNELKGERNIQLPISYKYINNPNQ